MTYAMITISHSLFCHRTFSAPEASWDQSSLATVAADAADHAPYSVQAGLVHQRQCTKRTTIEAVTPITARLWADAHTGERWKACRVALGLQG